MFETKDVLLTFVRWLDPWRFPFKCRSTWSCPLCKTLHIVRSSESHVMPTKNHCSKKWANFGHMCDFECACVCIVSFTVVTHILIGPIGSDCIILKSNNDPLLSDNGHCKRLYRVRHSERKSILLVNVRQVSTYCSNRSVKPSKIATHHCHIKWTKYVHALRPWIF